MAFAVALEHLGAAPGDHTLYPEVPHSTRTARPGSTACSADSKGGAIAISFLQRPPNGAGLTGYDAELHDRPGRPDQPKWGKAAEHGHRSRSAKLGRRQRYVFADADISLVAAQGIDPENTFR